MKKKPHGYVIKSDERTFKVWSAAISEDHAISLAMDETLQSWETLQSHGWQCIPFWFKETSEHER